MRCPPYWGNPQPSKPLILQDVGPKKGEGFPQGHIHACICHLRPRNTSCMPGTRQPSARHLAVNIPGSEGGCTLGPPTQSSVPSHLVEGVFLIPVHTPPCPQGGLRPSVLDECLFVLMKQLSFHPVPGFAAMHTQRTLLISASGFQTQTSKQLPFISGL